MKRTRSSRVLKKNPVEYTPTFPSPSSSSVISIRDKTKLPEPQITDPKMVELFQLIKKNVSQNYTIEFEVLQIYTNSSRMYCKMSEETFYYLFGIGFMEMEQMIKNCPDGFFPLKLSKLNEYLVVVKYGNLNQISILQDESEEYGYKKNIHVCGDVNLFTYFNYPEEHNYGLCLKLKSNLSFAQNE